MKSRILQYSEFDIQYSIFNASAFSAAMNRATTILLENNRFSGLTAYLIPYTVILIPDLKIFHAGLFKLLLAKKNGIFIDPGIL